MYFHESPTQAITTGVSAVTLTFLDTTAAIPATFARITLEPGATLTHDADAGPTVILVERGTSRLTPTYGGSVRVVTSDGGLHMRDSVQSIVPGELALLPAGTPGTWQAGNAEPVSLLVLTTGPTDATGSTAVLALTTGQIAPDAIGAPSPPATPPTCAADRQPDPTCR